MEDSTDIFGISGGGLNPPNHPLGTPLKVTVVHPVLGCVFSYSPRNTDGSSSAIVYLASNPAFTISWCLPVTHTPSDYRILSHGLCRKIPIFGMATGKLWLLMLFIQWIKDDRNALFAFVSIVTGLISNYCWCQTAVYSHNTAVYSHNTQLLCTAITHSCCVQP